MRKFKRWLYDRFLPAYCRDGLIEENRRLMEKTRQQEQEIERLNAYIDGMENAMLRQPRIIIKAREVTSQ